MFDLQRGILIGLLFAIATLYFIETYEELFEDDDLLKGSFFLIVSVGYGVFLFFATEKVSKYHVLILAIGSAVLIVLYAITREDISDLSHMGVAAKVIQGAIIMVCVLIYRKIKNS